MIKTITCLILIETIICLILIKTINCLHLKNDWAKWHGIEVAERLSKSNRPQTNTQYQFAWKAFLNWIKRNPEKPIDKSSLLLFRIYFCETKGLQPQTIKNYRSALRKPLEVFVTWISLQKSSRIWTELYSNWNRQILPACPIGY